MALGKQLSPVNTLVTFCLWARRAGLNVGEMYGFSSVNPRAHTKGSWHADREGKYGKAADLNKPGGGAAERALLVIAVQRAQELGLGVIFARDGTAGVAGTHRTHAHVDVGPFSHLGKTSFVPAGGGDRITRALQAAAHVSVDEVWGPATNGRLEAIRMSSRYHGGRFPQGVQEAQRAVGATPDGKWGPLSSRAHDGAVKAVQRGLGAHTDGVWGPATDRAFVYAQDLRWRR